MAFRRRWLNLPVVLVLMACDATYTHRGAGEDVAVGSAHSAAALQLGTAMQRDWRERDCATAAAHNDSPTALPQRVAASGASALNVGPADAPVPVCLDIGQALQVHLPASPATGYEWVLEDGVPPLLRVETDPGIEPARLRLGTGTVHSWGFRAERSGHAVLRFAYRRPWEASSMPTRSASFDVIVR